ncbi:hypothetical protein GCM10010104_70140 [Streptomyces indiaensis]|uniref:3-hydroxyacyl-CoA dehydrogenase n=1 Tax=Streptomyces indiaensis TaxID=284033 RepID=A0ABN3ELM8_9ACTN
MVHITGYGFPTYGGVPMFYAERVGAAQVLSALRRFHGDEGSEPASLLMRMADEAGSFN